MLNNFDIRVVATDGQLVKKILWVKSTKQHICYGFDMPQSPGHFTYHNNGRQHFKEHETNKTMIPTNKIPLKNFKGRTQVGGIGISIDSLQEYSDFIYDKCDSIVYIDTRTIPSEKNVISIDLQFVEANRMDLIYYFPDSKIIHVFRAGNPWVILSVW